MILTSSGCMDGIETSDMTVSTLEQGVLIINKEEEIEDYRAIG